MRIAVNFQKIPTFDMILIYIGKLIYPVGLKDSAERGLIFV